MSKDKQRREPRKPKKGKSQAATVPTPVLPTARKPAPTHQSA